MVYGVSFDILQTLQATSGRKKTETYYRLLKDTEFEKHEHAVLELGQVTLPAQLSKELPPLCGAVYEYAQ